MEIIQHACAALPREAVGIIGGVPGKEDGVVIPLHNIAGDRMFLAILMLNIRHSLIFESMTTNCWRSIIRTRQVALSLPPTISRGVSAWSCAHLIVALPTYSSAAHRSTLRMKAWRFGPGVGEYTDLQLLMAHSDTPRQLLSISSSDLSVAGGISNLGTIG